MTITRLALANAAALSSPCHSPTSGHGMATNCMFVDWNPRVSCEAYDDQSR